MKKVSSKKAMDSSAVLYWQDLLIRASGSKDFIYGALDLATLADRPATQALCRSLEKETGLFEKTRDFLFGNVTVHHGGREENIDEINFHPRWGWTVKNKLGEAHLGKVAISGSPHIRIGIGTYLSGAGVIEGSGILSIGCWCGIANGATLFTRMDNHQMNYPTTYEFKTDYRFADFMPHLPLTNYMADLNAKQRDGLTIEDEVWIGLHARVMPGVVLRRGSVVGSYGLITRDCEAFSVYVGVPARRIRYRFPARVRKELLAIDWPDWSMDRLNRNHVFFDTDLTKYQGRISALICK